MKPPPFFTTGDLADAQPRSIGGKAAGLRTLMESGLKAPPFIVVPAEWTAHPESLREALPAIQAAAGALLVPPVARLAIRSSSTAEDQRHGSAAGQFETVFIDTPEDLEAAILHVGTTMRGAGRLASDPVAVIVQAVVEGDFAGVLFSACPAEALPGEAYLEVVQGAGERLVSGAASPTRIHWDLERDTVARSVAGEQGLSELPLALLRQLVGAMCMLEQRLNAPVDVEWALAGDTLWFLQVRPVVALAPHISLLPETPHTSWFFDQRFREPISPLTRTTLLPLIARIAFEELLVLRHGVTAPVHIHFFAGQAYIPLAVYHHLMEGIPQAFLTADMAELRHGLPRVKSPFPLLRGACRIMFRAGGQILLNPRIWRRYKEELHAWLAAPVQLADASDLESWRASWDTLHSWSEAFLRIHRWSILLADGALFAVSRLPAVLGGEPVLELLRRLSGGLRLPTREANEALEAFQRGEMTREKFVADYGHRSASLDYSQPTWGECADDPGCRSQLPRAIPQPARSASSCAEGLQAQPGPMKRLLRRFLEMREEQRFEWERILGRQRALVLQIGALLCERNCIEAPVDVFYLTWEELLNSERTCMDRRTTVRLRRHARIVEAALDQPALLLPVPAPAVSGMRAGVFPGLVASPGLARGRARIIHTEADWNRESDGPIIAVTRALDPGWTIHLSQVAGLVVERGGLLSHAAIMAREYHIPMLAGVDQATRAIRDGDMVVVDTVKGVLEIEHEAAMRRPAGH
ncbi:MAG: hypothetical protein HYV27_23265 [Candidatus Hydrogenedentes bacterium]|nr:hypothetical protein [Candidatus Hydrogenedentota bacterium]